MDGARLSREEDCLASLGEEEMPPTRTHLLAIDVLNMRTCLSVNVYGENCKNRNKVPYVEFEINDVVVLSDEDEKEIKMYDMV